MRSARSSSAQPWTSPMMSKGPRSPRRSQGSGARRIVTPGELIGAAEHVNGRKPLVGEPGRAGAEAGVLALDRRRADAAALAGAVAGDRLRQREVEHDRDRPALALAGEVHELLSIFGAHGGGVDHREPAVAEALAREQVYELEGVGGGGLCALIVGDQRPEMIGRDDLGRPEVAGREARLADAGDADQDDQAGLGEEDLAEIAGRRAHGWWSGGAVDGSTRRRRRCYARRACGRGARR
jgi:hypothetical protein